MSDLNYPHDAEQVRDLIRDMLSSQADHGSSMDTGGGMGCADLWMTFGGREFYIAVRPRPATPQGER